MSLYHLFLIPILFGLIGFIEPRSLGMNIILLNRIKGFHRAKRISETSIFTLVRGGFLGLVGLSVAFLGSKIFAIQSSFFWVLGGIYIVLGGLVIVNMYIPIFRYEVNIPNVSEK